MADNQPSTKQPESSSSRKGPIETEILNVNVERNGQQVSAKWGLHPRLKEELTPEEWKELTDTMAKVTAIVGNRFAEILARGSGESGGTA